MSLSKKNFRRGIILRADDVAVEGVVGELKVGLTSKELHVYLDSALRTVATLDQVQTLSNKNLVDSSTAIVDAADATKKIVFDVGGTTGTTLTLQSAQTGNKTISFPDASTALLGTNTSQTVTNKIFVVSSNTVTTAASGNLTSTELNSALSELQADIDTRLAAAALTAHEADTSTHGVAEIVGTSETQTLSNKSMIDNLTNIIDNNDNTKKLQFQVSSVTTGTTSILTVPASSTTIVGTDTTQTISNKSLSDSTTSIVDASDATKKILFDAGGTTGTTSTITGAQTANRVITLPDATTTLVGTNNTATLSSKTIVVSANTVTTASSGNLAATELNAALAELQTDIDTRATTSALTTHTGASSGVHGVVGSVVGTTDTQTLTNKSLVDNSTFVVDSADSSKKMVFELSSLSSGVTRILTVPNTSTEIVGTGASQTLTNKVIDSALNTINTTASGNLAATELNQALQELQGDIDSLNSSVAGYVSGPASATDNAVPRFDLATGKLIQNSGVIISDTNAISGLAGITSSGVISLTGGLFLSAENSSTVTGSNQIITRSSSSSHYRLTAAGTLVSIGGFDSASNGQIAVIENATGANVTIVNEDATVTAANRFRTGTGQDLVLASGSAVLFKYNNALDRYLLIGAIPNAASVPSSASGNLSATNVQSALQELQTDIDTRATTTALTDHINDTTDAHAASAITNTPSGNLAAATVQAALNELQTDIDTRATSSALTTHTGASSGVHGISGAVVGTSDTQTLTNKSLQDSTTFFVDDVDNTKKLQLSVGNIGTGVTRTWSFPNVTATFVGHDSAQTLTNKTIVVSSNTITTASSGNLTAVELNSALAELQADIDTRATSTALTDHVNDTSAAHAASAVSVSAVTGLTATDVQGAIAELQADVDTRVIGPASSTATELASFSGTDGRTLQNTTARLTTAGIITGLTGITTSGNTQVGNFTHTGYMIHSGNTAESAATGANATIATPTSTTFCIRLTNASLTSLSGLASVTAGRRFVLVNNTGATITINHEDSVNVATATSRFATQSGGNVTLANNASVDVYYNTTIGRHSVLGGAQPAATIADGSITKAKLADGAKDYTTAAKTAAYTATASDQHITCDTTTAAFTITLPTAVGITGRTYVISKINSSLANVVTIDANASETIGGALTKKLVSQYESMTITSDGANWIIVEHYIPENWTSAGTITFDGTTTDPVKGTVNTDTVKYRRAGSNWEIEYYYYSTAATGANNGSGDYLFSLPTGIEFDTGTYTAYTSSVGASMASVTASSPAHFEAVGMTQNNGVGSGNVMFGSVYSATQFRITTSQGFSTTNQIGSGYYGLANTSLGFKFTIKFRGKDIT